MAKATVKNLDFTNVKEGGVFNTKRIEAGDYLAKVTKVEDAEVKGGENKGQAQYLFTIKLVDHSTSVFPYYCQLTEKSLWKLRNILVAAGMSVPKKRTKVDPNRIVGKLIGVAIEDDEHDGKERSTINGVFPASDLPDAPSNTGRDEDEEPEDEEEEDAPLPDEAPEEEPEDEPEEDEEEEDEAEPEADRLASMDRAALKAEIISHQADFRAKKSQTDDDLRDVLRGLIDGGDEEEEEEAPAPKPAAKKTAAKATSKAKKTTTKKAVEAVTDDELDELDIDNL